MNSYLEGLPSIVGNLGTPVTILNEFVLETKEIEGGARLTITSLSSGEVQTVDIMNAHTPEKGVDYWTESDQQEIVREAAAALPLDTTLLQPGKAADAGAVGDALDALEEKYDERIPEAGAANQILATDENGHVQWQEKTHYSTYTQETVFEEYTIENQSGAWIRDQSLLTDVVAGSAYTVVYNGKEYNLIAYNDENFGPSLGNVSILSSGEDTGEPFYFGNLSRAISQILAYFTTDGPHVFSIRGTTEKVTPLPGKYVGGGVYPGSGLYSTAIGASSAYASGQASVALNNAIAKGDQALAEGFGHAEGDYSHAEGSWTYATGVCSHAEGLYTQANGTGQHVQGKYNLTDDQGKYAHIVGNGQGTDSRANAHTLDWNGNAWFAGQIFAGGTGQDDDNAAEVAMKTDIPDAVVTPAAAAVGQALVVNAVDDTGKPTAWSAENVVKAINGAVPDESGNVETFHSVSFNFIDGSAVVPGLIQYYGKETMQELCSYLAASGQYNVECKRLVMSANNGVRTYHSIGDEIVRDAEGNISGRRLYFDDDLCPVILDIASNKIVFDPDWVKPAELPMPDAANQMLITDGSGQATWAERTHYAEVQKVVAHPMYTYTGTSANGLGKFTQGLSKGQECVVIHNGSAYRCIVNYNDILCTPTLGNAALGDVGDDTGEPFFVNNTGGGEQMCFIYFSTDGEHTLGVYTEEETIHPLDEKYLPSGVVKTVNGVVPDEAGNIVSDIAFPVRIMHVFCPSEPDSTMFNYVKSNKTAAQIREALFDMTKYASVVVLVYYNADTDETDYRYCKRFSLDLNGQDGGYRYILSFGDDLAPYIVDVNADTITLDPDWVASDAENILTDANGGKWRLVVSTDGTLTATAVTS